MNRERVALGSNGYESDLGFDLIERLAEINERNGRVYWLDLCCGWGNALVDAGSRLIRLGIDSESLFLGVDLVGMFREVPPEVDFVKLEQQSLHDFETPFKFDLITCVHGLHYIGDKLDLLARAVSFLQEDGQLVANVDLTNFQTPGNDIDFRDMLVGQGFRLDRENHLLSFKENGSPTPIDFGIQYLGADDTAGPNYTGQEAVNSHYAASLDATDSPAI